MKKALLFGINYTQDSKCSLSGCVNDARNVRTLLVDHFDFQPEDVLMCTDESELKPNKSMMLRLLRELILSTHRMNISQIFISYSGHGVGLGKDDSLVPLDFRTQGMITDYELAALIRQVHPRTDVVFLIDACHSGSMCNLPYVYAENSFVEDENQSVPCRALLISGCRDGQTASEWDPDKDTHETGIATDAFIAAVTKSNFDVTCVNLITYMNDFMIEFQYPQRPQLSSSRKLSETCVFVSSNDCGKAFFIL